MSKSRVTLIGLFAAVVLLYAGRSTIARYLPGLPAWYSAKPDIFTYENTYRHGRVGPFVVGQTKHDSLSVIHAGTADALVEVQISANPFTTEMKQASSLTEHDRRYLAEANVVRFATRTAGAHVFYRLRFTGDTLTTVDLTSLVGV